MDRQTQNLIGGLLIVIGLGAGGYYTYRLIRQRAAAATVQNAQIGFSAADLSVPGLGSEIRGRQALVAWHNGGRQPVAFGVQGVSLQAGRIVSGRWWKDENTAKQALGLFVAGNFTALAALAANPAARVVYTAPVPPGGRAEAALFAGIDPAFGREAVFWIMPNPPAGRLLVQGDTTGKALSALRPTLGAVQVGPQQIG